MKWQIKQTPFFERCFAEFVPKKNIQALRARVRQSLEYEANVQAKHRKKLEPHRYSALAEILAGREVWQLSVEAYRIFYEINERNGKIVILLLLGEKLNHETTDDMLRKIERLFEGD